MIATREVSTVISRLQDYKEDLKKDATGRSAMYLWNPAGQGTEGYLVVSPLFFDRRYLPGQLADTIIMVTACSSSASTALAEAFFRSGAHTYLGWDGTAGQLIADSIANNFLEEATQPVAPELKTVREGSRA